MKDQLFTMLFAALAVGCVVLLVAKSGHRSIKTGSGVFIPPKDAKYVSVRVEGAGGGGGGKDGKPGSVEISYSKENGKPGSAGYGAGTPVGGVAEFGGPGTPNPGGAGAVGYVQRPQKIVQLIPRWPHVYALSDNGTVWVSEILTGTETKIANEWKRVEAKLPDLRIDIVMGRPGEVGGH